MLKSWKTFFQELPEDIQQMLDNLAKGELKLREVYTKEMIDTFETDPEILSITDQDSKYRLAFVKVFNNHTKPSPLVFPDSMEETKLSEEDIEKFLKDPEIFNKTIIVIQSRGIVGETRPIKTIILICCGKLVKNKKTTSANAHVEDESGAGKDHLFEGICKVVFVDDWIKYNAPSPKAITYSQRVEKISVGKDAFGITQIEEVTAEKKITEDSIIYLEDASEQFLNDDDFKFLTDEENVVSTRVHNGRTIKFEWKKPIVIITTADTVTGNQLLRRLPSISLNTSKEQTKKITDFQLEYDCSIDADTSINEYKEKIVIEAFKKLKKVFVDLRDVRELIEEKKPKRNDVSMRTNFPRLLDYIKFSTALHQFQRKKLGEKDGFPILLADKQDVEIGFEIFNYIFCTDYFDVSNLNKRQRKIHTKLRENPNLYYSYNEISHWKESDGVSIQSLYNDIKRIMKEDNDIVIEQSKYPMKVGYKHRIRPKPLTDVGES